jgi:hypothetical protein
MTDYLDDETGEVRLPAVSEPQMQNLISASPECGEVFGALCDMQGEMDAPKRTKSAKVKGQTRNGQSYEYSYDYAPLDEIIKTIKKPMAGAGLAYRQFLAHRGEQSVVRTVIAHRSGQWMLTDYPIFWDQSRGMQGFASGVTYARRYGLMLALGIAAEDDDDANVADGNQADVQDRQKPASRGRTAQEAPRGTRVAPPPVPPIPEAAHAGNGVAAPSGAHETLRNQLVAAYARTKDELEREARAGHAEMVQLLESCESAGEVSELRESDKWKELHLRFERASTIDRAIKIMGRLGDAAQQRYDELMMEGISRA